MLSQFSIVKPQSQPAPENESGHRNKRARLVCFRCHEKKVDTHSSIQAHFRDAAANVFQIKCNLSTRESQQCSNCLDAGCQCRYAMFIG